MAAALFTTMHVINRSVLRLLALSSFALFAACAVPVEAGEGADEAVDTTQSELCTAVAGHPDCTGDNFESYSTNTAPRALAIQVGADSDGGTGARIELLYRNEIGTYGCFIPGPLTAGGVYSCATEWRSSTVTEGSTTARADYFYVGYADYPYSGDGLQVTGVSVMDSSGNTTAKVQFDKPASDAPKLTSCGGTFNNQYCNTFWIDNGGSPDCTQVKVWMRSAGEAKCIRR